MLLRALQFITQSKQKTCVYLRANLMLFKVKASRRKSTQVQVENLRLRFLNTNFFKATSLIFFGLNLRRERKETHLFSQDRLYVGLMTLRFVFTFTALHLITSFVTYFI